MKDILSLSLDELTIQITQIGYPSYRARQIYDWLAKGCRDFNAMTSLPAALRTELNEEFELYAPVMLSKQVSKEDGTVKFLWGLKDGNSVETVVMRYRYGNTVCISTQVGCRQGCAFCASTIGGLVRSLTAGEMVDEVLFSEKHSDLKISNIVLMGIGEPLDNLEQVLKFMRLISASEGRNIGMRHITLSTCGLPEQMDLLAQKHPITLTVSLHAPDDETRSKIMPSNRGVSVLMDACERYYQSTGRRISFEYSMISGVNDSVEQANLLAGYTKRLGAHVNLIPLNYVEERRLLSSNRNDIDRFQSILEQHGVNVTVRRRLGSDIDASCGQLRRKYSH